MFFVFLISYSFAQKNVYKAKDGSKITIETLDDNPDNGRNTAFYLGPIGYGGTKLIGFDHYKPTKHFVSTMIGFNNYMIDGNYIPVDVTAQSRFWPQGSHDSMLGSEGTRAPKPVGVPTP